MKQTLVKTGKLMLVTLFMSYYLSTVAFYHTHYFSWGTVTHSHLYFPFDKNSAQHTHTPIQCWLVDYLSSSVLIYLAVAAFSFTMLLIRRIYIPVRYYTPYSHVISAFLRAPPVSIC
jgi:hypothetical protein